LASKRAKWRGGTGLEKRAIVINGMMCVVASYDTRNVSNSGIGLFILATKDSFAHVSFISEKYGFFLTAPHLHHRSSSNISDPFLIVQAK
jgi:hypothetical protein